MNCPTCRQPMIVLELEEIEIDYCGACRGIWLDAGELELLLENASQASELLTSFQPALTAERTRKCPICLKKMEKVYADSLGQTHELLDRCPKNHGLWFDEGELQRLLQAASFDEEGKVKHLLGELFSANKGV